MKASNNFIASVSSKFATEPEKLAGPKDRKDVPLEETWDLTTVFADDEAWQETFDQVQAELRGANSHQTDLLASGPNLLAALQAYEDQALRLSYVYLYASLTNAQDVSDNRASGLLAKARDLATSFDAYWSFLTPALSKLTEDQYRELSAQESGLGHYDHWLSQLRKMQGHVLSDEEELVLSKMGSILNAGANISDVLTDSDLKFPTVQDDEGRQVELSHGRFIKMLESRKPEVRKNSFQAYYSIWKQFKNTLAASLQNQVKQDNVLADLRSFASAREAALFANDIPEQVYDQLIDRVHANIGLLHDYVQVRKQCLGLSDLHSYDLYVPIVKNVDFKVSMAEAQEIILAALAPLGEEYRQMLEEAFAERWIDYAENRGKRSGAFSSGVYRTKPYILINWQGTLDNLFTLAHELGHSCHTYLSNKNQSQTYADYCIFLAEIASTTNENLLTSYLLDHYDDPQLKLFVINHYLDGFKGTVFRQTQFAEFEHYIHQQAQAGEALTSDFMDAKYAELNRFYYGPGLTPDPEIAWEWARIPHFYYNYYVYQYATGFSAASSFAQRILSGDQAEVDRYLNFLRAGSSDYPIEVLKKAGLDMTGPEPINAAMQVFADFLKQFKEALA